MHLGFGLLTRHAHVSKDLSELLFENHLTGFQ